MAWISTLRIVLLSGAICSGKSTLVAELARCHGARLIKTRDLILAARPDTNNERAALQRAGERLDKADGGQWVSSALARVIDQARDDAASGNFFVVDSIRIHGQAAAIRQAFGTSVHHIHLTAALAELDRRFQQRSNDMAEPANLRATKKSKTERDIEKLAEVADIVVQTDRCTKDAVRVRATALLGLYPRSNTPLVDVLVGGQYGSEGKGNIVGHIAPEYRWLVRVGGPNAGHKVYAEPEPEAYFHIPSGAGRASAAGLILGAGSVIYVPKLLDEIARHKLSGDRLSIDPNAMIIEDEDKEFEKRLSVIASTGQGVGAASARKINDRGQPPPNAVRLAKDVEQLRPFVRESQPLLEAAFLAGEKVLLEGTQGTSLSLHHGPYPHVTSRDTTVAGCLADAGIAPTRVRRVIMVCRTFPIRVGGNSGPMENEITYEELARRSGIAMEELKVTETTTTTKRQRRLAEFDWVQFRRSALLNGPTDIALTFADYISIKNRQAYRYEQLTRETVQFVEELERVSGVAVSMVSTNFNWRNVIDRRSW